MNAPDTQKSTWGKPFEIDDPRALRRYNALLRGLAFVGEILSHILSALFLLIALGMLFMGNFENTIFSDGTSISCMLEGSTGEIVNVN